jgi:hypothetical protein
LNHSLQSGAKNSAKQPAANLTITILALVLIIVFTFMLTDSFKQIRLRNNLSTQIDKGTHNLASLEFPAPGLEQKLADIRNENSAVKTSLSGSAVSPREIIEAVLETAGNCHIKSNNLTADEWQEQNIGNSAYRVMPIKLNLNGRVPNLLGFIHKLENRQSFPSLVINDFSMSGPPEADPGQAAPNQAAPNRAAPDTDSGIDAKLGFSILVRTEPASEEH